MVFADLLPQRRRRHGNVSFGNNVGRIVVGRAKHAFAGIGGGVRRYVKPRKRVAGQEDQQQQAENRAMHTSYFLRIRAR